MTSLNLFFARVLAVLGAAPLIMFALVTARQELANFADPCFFFADTPGGNSIPAGCKHSSGTTETKARVILRGTLVQGSAFLAAIIGLIGGLRSRVSLIEGALMCLAALAVPLTVSGLALFVLFSGVCFGASFLLIRALHA